MTAIELPNPRDTWRLGPALFLRVHGLVLACAFGSIASQLPGLVGSQGLEPAATFLGEARSYAGHEAWALVPTVFWLDASDVALLGVSYLGVVLGLLVALGFVQGPALALSWFLYLSICSVGGDFLGFQWDTLLVETTFLAAFLAPWRRGAAPGLAAHWLLRLLLARLVFAAGFVKLASGDETWRSLAALDFHYETQPLPSWLGWAAHQLPHAVGALSCAALFLIELAAPLGLFGPRRLRRASAGAIAGLMLLIALTGSYGFFNLLTASLCLLFVDDAAFPAAVRALALGREPEFTRTRWRPVAVAAATAWLTVTGVVFVRSLGLARVDIASAALDRLAPLRTVNAYGLFAVMTTRRDEIRIEGSRDGVTWLEYPLLWKPGDPAQRPRFAGPHMPRLDWQLWFAALGPCEQSPWVERLGARLIQGSPEVKALFAADPFPDAPPDYVRTTIARRRFTDVATLRGAGTWWIVEEPRPFCPVATATLRQARF